MAEDIHTGDPANYSWLSSTSLQHNISITFTDVQDNAIFDVDSRPSSDPKQYRHKIALRFSKPDSTIRIRETFATVHAGKEFHGKVAKNDDQMSVTATLMLPGHSFVVEKGAQESRPWPEKGCFVIKLAFQETGIAREMLSLKHVGDNTTRLESECGELDLRRHLKKLGEVKGLMVCVENYRGNRTFGEDEVREVLLPRFAVKGNVSSVLAKGPLAEVGGMPAQGVGGLVAQRTTKDQVDELTTSRKRKAQDEVEVGGKVEEGRMNRQARRRRRKLKKLSVK
jgi:hypothetical protein